LMLRHRWAHVIATDSHNADSRPPRLSQAVAAVTEILGEAAGVRRMVADTPRQIIEGRPLDPPTPLPLRSRRRKKWRERLFGDF
jgi:tyrosine-protein phosphatase YwqE